MKFTTIDEPVNYCPPIPEPETRTITEPVDSDFSVPRVYLNQYSWAKIFNIIKAAGEYEVGFLGSVESIAKYEYLVDDVFLFKQTVSRAECDFDQKDLGKFYGELLKEKNGKDKANRMMFWGHLHPHNSVEPSAQDDDQMALFKHNEYFIRGIFTQTGEAKFDFFDYKHELKFLRCPWQIHMPEDDNYKEIKKEVKKKSKIEKFVYSTNSGPFYGGHSFKNEHSSRNNGSVMLTYEPDDDYSKYNKYMDSLQATNKNLKKIKELMSKEEDQLSPEERSFLFKHLTE